MPGETAKDVTATVVGKTVEVARREVRSWRGVQEAARAASADGSADAVTPEVYANTELSVLEAKRRVERGRRWCWR